MILSRTQIELLEALSQPGASLGYDVHFKTQVFREDRTISCTPRAFTAESLRMRGLVSEWSHGTSIRAKCTITDLGRLTLAASKRKDKPNG